MNPFTIIRVAIMCCGCVLALDYAAPNLKGLVIEGAHPGAKFVSARDNSPSLISQAYDLYQETFGKGDSAEMSGLAALRERNSPSAKSGMNGLAAAMQSQLISSQMSADFPSGTRRSVASAAARPAGN